MREHVYLVSSGIVYRDRNTLVVAGEEKIVLPVKRIASLHIYGNVSVSSPTLSLLSKHGIPMYFFSKNYRYLGTFIPSEWRENGKVLLAQVKNYFERRLEIAKVFLESLRNSMLIFIKNHYNPNIAREIRNIDLGNAASIPELMGLESVMWKWFYGLLREELDFLNFDSRVYRPPKDNGNAVLSFVNSLLYGNVTHEIYNAGLFPSIGFLHEVDERKHALVLDVADIFKPLISAHVLLVADRCLQPGDFQKVKSGVYLSKGGVKKIIDLFEGRIRTVVNVKKLRKAASIRTAIRSFCVHLRDCLVRGKKLEPYVPW